MSEDKEQGAGRHMQSEEKQIQNAEQQMQNAEQQMQNAEQQMQSAEQQMHSAERQMQSAEQQMQSVEQQMQSAEQQMQSAEQQMHSAERQMQSAEQQMHSAERQMQSAEQQMQSTEQQMQSAEQQIQRTERQTEQSHAGLLRNHQGEQHNPVHAPIPGLGFRSIKTALATAFTALLYAFLPNSNPTFACIGAIFGMGADMEESRRSGGNRFFGTVIGGFIGLGLYWLEHLAYPEGCYWLRLPMVFLGVIILISMCVLFHWPGGVQPGGVVLCIILFNTPAHHIDYAIHRMIDTGIGVIIALLVNYFLPRSRLEHWFRLDQERKRKKSQRRKETDLNKESKT